MGVLHENLIRSVIVDFSPFGSGPCGHGPMAHFGVSRESLWVAITS